MNDLLKRPRISRATIARLHNRGNYEHSRYEVTVEIPAGVDAGSVMAEVDQILNDLAPNPPCSAWQLNIHLARLQKAPEPLDPHDQREREHAANAIKHNEDWKRRRDEAYQRFTALSGSERFTDAKTDWQDDDDN